MAVCSLYRRAADSAVPAREAANSRANTSSSGENPFSVAERIRISTPAGTPCPGSGVTSTDPTGPEKPSGTTQSGTARGLIQRAGTGGKPRSASSSPGTVSGSICRVSCTTRRPRRAWVTAYRCPAGGVISTAASARWSDAIRAATSAQRGTFREDSRVLKRSEVASAPLTGLAHGLVGPYEVGAVEQPPGHTAVGKRRGPGLVGAVAEHPGKRARRRVERSRGMTPVRLGQPRRRCAGVGGGRGEAAGGAVAAGDPAAGVQHQNRAGRVVPRGDGPVARIARIGAGTGEEITKEVRAAHPPPLASVSAGTAATLPHPCPRSNLPGRRGSP